MPAVRGLTVVGCGLDSGEARVALAACDAARAAGEDVQLFVTGVIGPDAEAEAELVVGAGAPVPHALRTPASPAIAARHAGAQLNPAALVEAARAEGDGTFLVA